VAGKTKLELTWIGKDKREKLEPRVLIEDRSMGHASPSPTGAPGLVGNVLIKGDNLLALKALEEEYRNKVKVIYIDPPFNTGAAMEHYDDGVEHSIWLRLFSERITRLKSLLSDDGSIFVHLDDNELDYAKVLMDEVFGRKNFVNRITVEARSPSAFSTVNPGVFKASEYILWYAKKKESFTQGSGRVPRTPDYAYNKWLLNPEDHYSEWKFSTLLEAYEAGPQSRSRRPDSIYKHFNDFIVENADRVVRLAEISNTGAGQETVELKKRSLKSPTEVLRLERKNADDIYVTSGQQIIFYSKNVHEIDGEKMATKFMTNIWDDIGWEGIAKEGGVKFPKGKKPERLIRRCLDLTTNPGDLVLDSFAGSGTTGAVAHKMGRRWIMVELGDHADTHIVPRLKKIIDGQDTGGITKATGWQGGGGYRYFRLAPSLLEKDQWGQYVISKEYQPEMLAEAVCKLMGFTYAPSQDHFWQHGHSTENDFIYVTTQRLTHDALRKLSHEVGEGRTLLVCCRAHDENTFDNLTVRKIPHAVMAKCEWGRDDYSLNIQEASAEPITEGDLDEDDTVEAAE
jgi:adenine-specific DNA-methyltransferase